MNRMWTVCPYSASIKQWIQCNTCQAEQRRSHPIAVWKAPAFFFTCTAVKHTSENKEHWQHRERPCMIFYGVLKMQENAVGVKGPQECAQARLGLRVQTSHQDASAWENNRLLLYIPQRLEQLLLGTVQRQTIGLPHWGPLWDASTWRSEHAEPILT